ncbi:NADP-dependent oxidoreductase domain-containing protein [Mycena pura]|uniref:NADP-dependent oxidoreductase domain-containing protein n=1 Tax=Mycena pura TaxID=153505 RepID=A0AAD6YAM0_9AGAR|nr:NADP-dependent oxidoreductase domain-containing protein [Mycena pura]
MPDPQATPAAAAAAPDGETTFQLGPFAAPRVWTGLWQLSSNAWGTAPVSKIRQAMGRHVAQGHTAFADHYGSAELIFGQFRLGLDSPDSVLGATKWCVFKPITVNRETVEAAVRQRMERMQTTRVDLLQFHWQNYDDHAYLDAIAILRELQAEGLIAAIGLCNFDAARTDEICTRFPGLIVSNQIQFSLVDTRPLYGMTEVCRKHGVKLLTYGTLCGGFLADKWLAQPEPDPYAGSSALNPSQRKYLDMILKAWGTWDLFQDLLRELRRVGDRHGGLSISNIATRWVLDEPTVGAVLIGARLGCSEYPDDNARVFTVALTADDRRALAAVLKRSRGARLIESIGDCGAEYR